MPTRRQTTTETREKYLKAARRYCRTMFKKLMGEDGRYPSHSSHYAAKSMELTESRFVDLGTFGVEGWCDSEGKHGVSYLNTGDTYEITILFSSETERFSIGSWGDIAESRRWN